MKLIKRLSDLEQRHRPRKGVIVIRSSATDEEKKRLIAEWKARHQTTERPNVIQITRAKKE